MVNKTQEKKYHSSITRRLFINIFIVLLSFAAVVMISNAFFLRPLYTLYSERTIEHALEALVEIDYTANEADWIFEINEIERNNNFEVLIYDGQRIVYSTSSQPRWLPSGTPGQAMRIFFEQLENGNPDITPILRGGMNQLTPQRNNLIFTHATKNGYTILVTQILNPVNNTIRQTNIVILAVTSLFLVLALIIAFRLSKRFTRPIKKIQSTVANITALNFDSSCDVYTNDELEHLADDVNALSDRLKATLEQLKVQNEQLEKDIISQRQFISNASHELRTPLSLIKGYADEIGSGYVSDKKQQGMYINIISEETNKMNRLLKEMLDLSRMESGRMALERQKLSINDLVNEFVDKYDGYIQENKLNLTIELTEKNTAGLVDPMRFEQILANYLSNAAKYSDDAHIVKITTTVKKNKIRVALYNSGRHIPKDMLTHIWDRFYKHDDGRVQTDGSYGLGLSIVAAIQALAGQAYGAENVDDGVIFWFEVEKAG